jgi:molybdopterin molybdotransferase
MSSKLFHDVRMRGFRNRTDVDDVRKLLEARVRPLGAEPVDLHQAAGRVLAEDVTSAVAVPPFDRAAMDGYALRGAETFGAGPYNPLELAIVGLALPGRPFAGLVRPGQAVRIMTGAPVPAGADAVLQAESAEEADGRVRITEAVPPAKNIGKAGEDIEPGTVVLRAGRVLRPQDVGVLSSIGVGRCWRGGGRASQSWSPAMNSCPADRSRRAIASFDSNSIMLAALVRRDGGEPLLPVQMVPDQRDLVRAALSGSDADVILVSGGSSVGQEDHAPQLVAELGELCVHGVALRPASPTGIGFLQQRPVFLLPGNPVSCLCGYDLFAGLAVRKLGGRATELPYRCSRLPLARKISSAVGRVDYVRVRVEEGRAEPLAVSGVSLLSSTTRADGFVLVERDSGGRRQGKRSLFTSTIESCSRTSSSMSSTATRPNAGSGPRSTSGRCRRKQLRWPRRSAGCWPRTCWPRWTCPGSTGPTSTASRYGPRTPSGPAKTGQGRSA